VESAGFDRLSYRDRRLGLLQGSRQAAGKVKRVIGYFNNHYHGYATENCLYLIEKLGLLSEEQKRAKAKTAVKQSQLGAFF
jgi:uncharacterized protein YecE (DUF72 family)